MSDRDLQSLRQIIKEEVRAAVKDEVRTVLANELKPIHQKLDALTAELAHVHQLAVATYDLLILTRESFGQELDEIRRHIGLPPKERPQPESLLRHR